MASISDFLTEGAKIPAGSALKAMSTETVMPPWYTDAAMQTMSNQLAEAATPYSPFKGPRVAEFSPDQIRSFGMTKDAAGAYKPGLDAATAATTGVMQGPGGLSAAQPYLNAAAGSTVGNIGSYMNPYNEQVTSRIAELGSRNLTENLLPGIEGRYIAAGQLGFGGRGGAAGTPSGMMTDTARALRGTQEAVLAEQNKALQAGYTEAAGLAAGDLTRMGTLASTAGNLGGTDATRTLSAADQLGGLATSAQALGLTGANAVGAVGAQQQGQAQKNIDVAVADDLRQKGYPQEQIDAVVRTLQGLGGAVPKGVSEVGIEPTNRPLGPSTGETILGGLTSVGGILAGAKPGTALGNLLGL